MRTIVATALACLAILTNGCTTTPPTPQHYSTLEDYLIAHDRDLTGFYRHADPDKLMQCYAQVATNSIPPETRPDVLAVANKSTAGQPLSPAEQTLKSQWLDARPRPEGDVLNVETPRALNIVREMATTCWGINLS